MSCGSRNRLRDMGLAEVRNSLTLHLRTDGVGLNMRAGFWVQGWPGVADDEPAVPGRRRAAAPAQPVAR